MFGSSVENTQAYRVIHARMLKRNLANWGGGVLFCLFVFWFLVFFWREMVGDLFVFFFCLWFLFAVFVFLYVFFFCLFVFARWTSIGGKVFGRKTS